MSASVKVVLIGLFCLLTIHHWFGDPPSSLGSWSSGIDLQRQAIVETGHLEAPFYDATQASWFPIARSESSYSVVFGAINVLAGAHDLQSSLWQLYWLPPALLVLAAASAAWVHQFAAARRRPAAALLLAVAPLLTLFPIGRVHVILAGHAGNALAPALFLLSVALLVRVTRDPPPDPRFVVTIAALILLLVFTYHTWTLYFALIATIAVVLGFLARSRLQPQERAVAGVLAIAPLASGALMLFSADNTFLLRAKEAFHFLKTQEPGMGQAAGVYVRRVSGDVTPFLRQEAVFALENSLDVLNAGFFLLMSAFAIAAVFLTTSDRFVRAARVLALGTMACIGGLLMVGGSNAAVARLFEILGATGPVMALCVAASASLSRPARLALWGVIVFGVLFAATAAMTAAVSAAAPPMDERLDSDEARAIASVAEATSPDSVVWSDHRLAPAFLYEGPHAFTTAALAVPGSEREQALVEMFYTSDCSWGQDRLEDSDVRVALTSRYMEEVGVVPRGWAGLAPPQGLFECLEASGSRVYDNGAVAAYALAR